MAQGPGGNPTFPFPRHPVRGRRRQSSGERPLPPVPSETSASRAQGPHPRNLTPSPPRAAPERSTPGPRGPRRGSGDPARGKIPPTLPPRVSGPCARRAERAGGRISGGTGRALRTMVPWRWGLTGPRGIALPPAARPGPLHEAPRWGPPPRRAPRPWPPGARPGGRRRRAAASPAAEQLRPQSLGRGGRGARGADWSPRVSWGRRLDA